MRPKISNATNIIDIIDNTLAMISDSDYQEYLKNGGSLFDFKSIFLKLPRRSGHTTAAFELLTSYPKSWIIYPKMSMALDAMKDFDILYNNAKIFNDSVKEIDHLSMHIMDLSLMYDSLRGKNFDIDLLIFDNYSHLQSRKDIELRDKLLHHPVTLTTKLFVFLQ